MKKIGLFVTALFLVSAPAFAQETELPTLRSAAQGAPRDAQAQTAYGRALLQAGRWREAEAQFRKAAQLAHNSPESLYDIARVAFEKGDNRAARTACRALERADRQGPLTHVCRARAALTWNRSALAYDEISAALDVQPSLYEGLVALGDARRIHGEVSQAEDAYRRAIGSEPGRPEAHLGLGRLYMAANRANEGLAEYRRALQADPNSPVINFELGHLVTGSEARSLLERAVAGRPTWAEPQAALGDLLLAANDLAGAQRAYEAAIAADRESPAGHSGLGRVFLAQEKYQDAERELNRALQILQNSKITVLALGDVYARTDRVEDALEQYRHAADLDPRDATGLVKAATLALAVQRDVLAAGFLDRLLEALPNNAAGLALYGDVMKARHDNAQARSYYQRALNGEGPLDRARVQAAVQSLGR